MSKTSTQATPPKPVAVVTMADVERRVKANATAFTRNMICTVMGQATTPSQVSEIADRLTTNIVEVLRADIREKFNLRAVRPDQNVTGYELPIGLREPLVPARAGPVAQGSGERIKCTMCNRLYAAEFALAQHMAASHSVYAGERVKSAV